MPDRTFSSSALFQNDHLRHASEFEMLYRNRSLAYCLKHLLKRLRPVRFRMVAPVGQARTTMFISFAPPHTIALPITVTRIFSHAAARGVLGSSSKPGGFFFCTRFRCPAQTHASSGCFQPLGFCSLNFDAIHLRLRAALVDLQSAFHYVMRFSIAPFPLKVFRLKRYR